MEAKCISCGNTIAGGTSHRKYCDRCRKERSKGWTSTNESIGLKKYSRIKGVYVDD